MRVFDLTSENRDVIEEDAERTTGARESVTRSARVRDRYSYAAHIHTHVRSINSAKHSFYEGCNIKYARLHRWRIYYESDFMNFTLR